MKVGKPFSGKTRDVSEVAPEKSKSLQAMPKIKCELLWWKSQR